MFVMMDLPRYDLFGLVVRPGDVLGRTKPTSIFEHTFLLCFDGEIAHSSGPGDVFRPGRLEEILRDGGVLRVVDPTTSIEETQRRFIHANRLMGVGWWNMNCRQTTTFIVTVARTPWLM
jgi:hypothetical protein